MPAEPGRVVEEPQREAGSLPVVLRDVAERGGALGEQRRAQGLLGGVHLVQRALELRELADQAEDESDVIGRGRAYDDRGAGRLVGRHGAMLGRAPSLLLSPLFPPSSSPCRSTLAPDVCAKPAKCRSPCTLPISPPPTSAACSSRELSEALARDELSLCTTHRPCRQRSAAWRRALLRWTHPVQGPSRRLSSSRSPRPAAPSCRSVAGCCARPRPAASWQHLRPAASPRWSSPSTSPDASSPTGSSCPRCVPHSPTRVSRRAC